MIPLRDVIPSRTTPFVTVTLIVITAAAWLLEISMKSRGLDELLSQWGVVPAGFAAPALVTSMFLHGSWLVVIANMWCLWLFGDNIEDRLGHGPFLAFYLLSGVSGALAAIVMDPSSTRPEIGAGGAVSGVMGAYFVLYPKSRVLVLVPLIVFWDVVELPAIGLAGAWLVVQLISGTSVPSLVADIAGLFVGVMVGVVLTRRASLREWWSWH
jgi:membrane associated rhomboid family serine protease